MKKIVLIGDSIRLGYEKYVKEAFEESEVTVSVTMRFSSRSKAVTLQSLKYSFTIDFAERKKFSDRDTSKLVFRCTAWR